VRPPREEDRVPGIPSPVTAGRHRGQAGNGLGYVLLAMLTVCAVLLGAYAGRTDAPPPPAPVTVTTPAPPVEEWSCEEDMGGIPQPDGTCRVDEPAPEEVPESWMDVTLV
jgi:hypothetical protein